MKKIFSKDFRLKEKCTDIFRLSISTLLGLMIAVLVVFIGHKIYTLFFFPEQEHFIHDIVFLIVLIKILLLLLSYFQHHHISIKYIVEISIIAPAIEIIFASDTHTPFILSLFAIFSLANLLIYILFQEKIKKINT